MKLPTIFSFLIALFVIGSEVKSHSPHDNVHVVAFSPNYALDQVIFCSLSHRNHFVLRSENGGKSWSPSQRGIPHSDVVCLAISPDYDPQNGVVFAGTRRKGLFRSADGGRSWTSTTDPIRIATIAISPDFAIDQVVFHAAIGRGVYKSTNAGVSWTPSGLGGAIVTRLSISPFFSQDQTIFAATGGGIFKSTDGGLSWTLQGQTNILLWKTVVVSPSYGQDTTLFAGSWGKGKHDGVYRSTNGGSTWSNMTGSMSDTHISDIVLSPDYATDKRVFVATQSEIEQYGYNYKGVYTSADGGNNWTQIDDGIDDKSNQLATHYFSLGISPDFTNDKTVLLCSFEGLHQTNEDLNRWMHMNIYSRKLVRGITVSPDFANDGHVFAGAMGTGIYWSQTGGGAGTWEPLSTRLSGTVLWGIEASRTYSAINQDKMVFAGRRDGVERLSVGGPFGLYWELRDVNENSSHFVYVKSLALSPQFGTDQTLFTGDGHGKHQIYRSLDGGEMFYQKDCLDGDFATTYCMAVAPDFCHPVGAVFAGTGGSQSYPSSTMHGVFRSVDGQQPVRMMDTNGMEIFAIAVSPSYANGAGEVLAGTTENGIMRSVDGGDSWFPYNEGIGNATVIEALCFASDGTRFAGTKSSGLFRRDVQASAWELSSPDFVGRFIRSIAVSHDYVNDETIFVGHWDGLEMSSDGGRTWAKVLGTKRYDDQSDFVEYDGSWTFVENDHDGQIDDYASGPGVMTSETAGDLAEYRFFGKSITWVGKRSPDGGLGNVRVDDNPVWTQVDLYSTDTRWQDVLFTWSDPSGVSDSHKIQIEVVGDHIPPSTGNHVFIDAFDTDY